MATLYSTRVTVQPRGGGNPVDAFDSTVPAGIEPDTMRAYYTQRFGEPLDDAYTDGPSGSRVDIGWVFEVPAQFELPGPPDEFEMVVIPVTEDPEQPGMLVSVWLLLAEQRAKFEQLVDEGKVDRLVVVSLPERQPGEEVEPKLTIRESPARQEFGDQPRH